MPLQKPEVATCAEKSRMVKKIWVTVLSTGDVVEIDVDQVKLRLPRLDKSLISNATPILSSARAQMSVHS